MAREGRPLKYEDHEKLKADIEEYFATVPFSDWTITGLALHLDTSRKTLLNYEEKPEFVHTIKRAKEKVESSYELDLKRHGRTGTIFALKNFDWEDSQTKKIEGNSDKPLNVEVKGIFEVYNEFYDDDEETENDKQGEESETSEVS